MCDTWVVEEGEPRSENSIFASRFPSKIFKILLLFLSYTQAQGLSLWGKMSSLVNILAGVCWRTGTTHQLFNGPRRGMAEFRPHNSEEGGPEKLDLKFDHNQKNGLYGSNSNGPFWVSNL
jgi:hypothetical protein